MNWEIDKEICTLCRECEKICPSDAVKAEEALFLEERCIQCGHCFSICPVNAISDSTMEKADLSIKKNIFTQRRSVRKFKQNLVPSELLHEVLRIGSYSPTASNSRNWSVRVVQGKDIILYRREICRSFYKTIKLLDNPIIRFFIQFTPLKRYASKKEIKAFLERLRKSWKEDEDTLFYHAPAVFFITHPASNKRFGSTDTAIAAHQMVLYGESRGLGSLYVGFAEQALHSSALRKKLGFHKKERIGQVVAFGFPAVSFKRAPPRQFIIQEKNSNLFFSQEITII